MPRDSNGNYSLPAGNPVVSGTVASSTVHNNTMNDLAAEMEDSLSRSGKGGMQAPFEFDDGTVGDPAATFASEPNSGLYRAGANDIRFSLAGVDLVQLSTALVKVLSHATDGATAVAMAIDTVNALSTAGAKLLRLLNNAVEKFYVDKDGNVQGGGLFQALAAVGATLKGNVADGATAVGVILDCVTALTTSGAKALSVRNAGVEQAYIDKDGNIQAGGLFQSLAALSATLKGNIADGASAVGVILDCVNALSTSGAKALSIRNAGVEKAYIDKDGKAGLVGADLGSGKITGLADGIAATDAATVQQGILCAALVTGSTGAISSQRGLYSLTGSRSSAGVYALSGAWLDKTEMVFASQAQSSGEIAANFGPGGTDIQVRTYDSAGSASDRSFYILVFDGA